MADTKSDGRRGVGLFWENTTGRTYGRRVDVGKASTVGCPKLKPIQVFFWAMRSLSENDLRLQHASTWCDLDINKEKSGICRSHDTGGSFHKHIQGRYTTLGASL